MDENETDFYERVLNGMPAIAEAVNAFKSEDVQRAAFDVMIRALGTPGLPAAQRPDLNVIKSQEDTEAVHSPATSDAKNATRKPRRTGSRKPWFPVRDLDFWPSGMESLQDFAKRTQPLTNHQRNLVAVYYLEQVMHVSPIGVGHVLSVYKACSWREPGGVDGVLRKTASKYHWIDTSDTKSIKTTPGGRNVVEHDMPIVKARKA